jgi:GAF domain-containing protein
MPASSASQELPGTDLESVLATAQLDLRGARDPDKARETRLHLALVADLARAPEAFFDKLVQSALGFVRAGSAGVSLASEERGRFVWPAVAGALAPYVGEGTPREFGPCGTVLDRGCPLLFQHPERHFTYLEPIAPPLCEVLLVPFHVDGRAVGTVWAVAHDEDRHFDAEDRRALEGLSEFAASAYVILVKTGALRPWIGAG